HPYSSKSSGWWEIRRHPWGKGSVLVPYLPPEIATGRDTTPTVLQRYETRRKKELKEGASDKAEKLLELAKWALQHGLVDKVPALMEELAKEDAKNPAVAVFQKVKGDIGRRLNRDDPVLAWAKDKLSQFKAKQSEHYTLIYDVPNEARAQQ